MANGALDGKVAIVTGGSRGIGRAIAIGFAKEGARVLVAGRSSDPGGAPLTIEGTVREIEDLGGEAIAVRCDVTDESDAHNIALQAYRKWGSVDVLVNNAGVLWPFGLLDTNSSKFTEIMRTNIDGVFFCSMAVVPYMMQQGGGSIVNISSGRGHSEDPRSIAYAATKAAVSRLSIKFGAEMKPYNIAVNAIDPGATLTEKDTFPFMDRSGWKRTEEKNIIPACIFLAQQRGDGFTAKEVDEAQFHVTWP